MSSYICWTWTNLLARALTQRSNSLLMFDTQQPILWVESVRLSGLHHFMKLHDITCLLFMIIVCGFGKRCLKF